MGEKVDINIDQYPIIKITPISELGEDDIDKFGEDLEKILLSKEGKFIIISNTTHDISFPVNVRIKLGKVLNYISGRFYQRELAVYVIIKSAFGRMMMSCIGLVAKNQNLKVVSSLEEATEKAEKLLMYEGRVHSKEQA